MNALVVIVHTADGLCVETVDAVREQWSYFELALTPVGDPFAYAKLLRGLWPYPGELVIVEQDVVPPPDSIRALVECPRDWCTHRHWNGYRHDDATTALVKLSRRLRRRRSLLMDHICCRPDPRYWVRMGWTRIPRDCSVTTLNGSGRRASLMPGYGTLALPSKAEDRPTTHDWLAIDTDLARELRRDIGDPHVHEPPHLHLHDYQKRPVGSDQPWHQRPYVPSEWPD